MKKLTRTLTAIILAALLCACGAQPAGTTAAPAEEKTFTVGICQLVQHVALDAATKGFRDALEKELANISKDSFGGNPAPEFIYADNLKEAVDILFS